MTTDPTTTDHDNGSAIIAALMPDVGHSSQPPAQVLVDAAWKLRHGYEAGGSNVSAAIATLLDRVAAAIDPTAATTYEGDRPWPAREVEDLLGEAQLVRSIGATPVNKVDEDDREWFAKHPLAAIDRRPDLDVVITWLEARS